ncbi:hypothetical protein [Polaribacter sp. P097]|uniref:hypothetical protein n=1 Tax=Polaribacter sp. P097 TaxID=3117398 RepID=UPI002FE407DD
MKKIASITLILIILFSCSNKTDNVWKEKSEVLGTWIKLERDDKGYLIYDFCEGNNNFIGITKNNIIYNLSQESPDTLKIDFIKILKTKNEIEFSGSHEFYSIKSILKIIDSKNNLYLLKWELQPKSSSEKLRKGKMMITRKDHEKYFRFIDNPCDNVKIPEKEFLPVEYE